MPFDNYVKTVKVKAEDIVNVAYSGMQLSLNAYISGGFLYIDHEMIDPDTYVSVATIDYVFDNPSYPFLTGIDPFATGVLFRDYLILNIRELCQDGSKWMGQAS
jgi:hypothetical protein